MTDVNKENGSIRTSPLDKCHKELGGKMVSFAGYSMPLHFQNGILSEHFHTRTSASLFDVSHMGQIYIQGSEIYQQVERFVPANLVALKPWSMSYTQLINTDGGILDDIIITKTETGLIIIANASRAMDDYDFIQSQLSNEASVELKKNRALMAIQGPCAELVLSELMPEITDLEFMTGRKMLLSGVEIIIARCGYTGEDGFEISIDASNAEKIWNLLLSNSKVLPAGLGARDTLRLEAGLCLYGTDIDESTSPVEAGLSWSIPNIRRTRRDFAGADRIMREILEGPPRCRVGISLDSKILARGGAEICSLDGQSIGRVTSGSIGPSVGHGVAMGYVKRKYAQAGTDVIVLVRNKSVSGHVIKLPFVPHRYKKKL